MKIIIAIPFLSNGGAEKIAAKWCYDLNKEGIDTTLLVHYRMENEYKISSQIPIEALYKSKDDYNAASLLKTVKKIRQFLKKQGEPLYIIPFIPHVGIQCFLANLGLDNYLVETIRVAPQFSPQNKFYRFLRDLSVFFADGCIFQNEEQMEYFPRKVRKRGCVIYNTVPEEFLRNYEKKEYNQIEKIIMVSRLTKQKNHTLMLKAMAMLKKKMYPISLTIVGDGPEYENIKKIISDLQLEKEVDLLGRSSNVGELLINSDLYILTSDFEGMPNSLMEAMACGLPCISTSCPTGPSNLIDNGINGTLIPVNGIEELVNAIIYYIENNELSVEHGKKSRIKIININQENNINRLIDYLRDLS